LNSCYVYEISWRNYSSYSDARVVFTTQVKETVWLNLNRTKRFRVSTPIESIVFQRPYGSFIHVYPFFNKEVVSEIFFYDVRVISHDERSVILEAREGVEAYFVEFYINDLRYTVISKNNILTIGEPQEITNMNEVLTYIEIADFTFISNGRTDYDGVVIGGYIVRSKIDNSIRWLRPWI
jgi:hypothetical protein